MNRNYIKSLSVLCSAALLLGLTSCGKDEKILESSKKERTTVMTVGKYEVPMELYRYIALNSKADFENNENQEIWLGEEGNALLEKLNGQIKDTVIRMYTTVSMCESYDINIDDEYIKDAVDVKMDEIYEGYENDYELYSEDISKYYMTDYVYRFIMRNDILSEELIAKMMENGDIPSSDEELEEILGGAEFVRVKQILIPADNGNSDEANLKKAEEVLALVNSGADFDELIKKYGGDLYLFNNEAGYYISPGNYQKNFEDAAFELEIGETSGIVKTDAGYSIIKRYPKDAEYIAENFNALCDDYIRGQYNLILERHAESLTATETDEIKNYSIFSMTMDD